MFAAKNILGNSELQDALKVLNKGHLGKEMSNLLVLVQKANNNSDKFYRMFLENREWLLKILRAKIGKSSLYRFFCYRIDDINAILKLNDPSLFFVERRHVKKSSQILTSYCVNPNCSIYESEGFFILKFNGQNENTDEREFETAENGRKFGAGSF